MNKRDYLIQWQCILLCLNKGWPLSICHHIVPSSTFEEMASRAEKIVNKQKASEREPSLF